MCNVSLPSLPPVFIPRAIKPHHKDRSPKESRKDKANNADNCIPKGYVVKEAHAATPAIKVDAVTGTSCFSAAVKITCQCFCGILPTDCQLLIVVDGIVVFRESSFAPSKASIMVSTYVMDIINTNFSYEINPFFNMECFLLWGDKGA